MEAVLPEIQMGHTIGSGTFGKVRSAIHLPSRQQVAVKVLNKSRITTQKDMTRIEREISILKHITHPNILRLYQVAESSKSYFLVTNLVEGEELYQRINRTGGLSEQEAALLFVQLLDAALCLHQNRVAHRDIKP